MRAEPLAPTSLRPLKRVVLADEVSRTLFREFAEHRSGKRGDEEIGWVLLGTRAESEALVLATLPAGASRDASRVHVQFNSSAQAVGGLICRQENRRLLTLGVVHTHPGSLRHPSSGDLRGDRVWVKSLRGGEGIFAIGTADAPASPQQGVAWQPADHVQCWGQLRLSWYSLQADDTRYRPLSISLTLGPDLAHHLRPVWSVIEDSAERLERLLMQQRGIRFGVIQGMEGSEASSHRTAHALCLRMPLHCPDQANLELEIQLEPGQLPRYVLWQEDEPMLAGLSEPRVDRGVYQLLAELAEHHNRFKPPGSTGTV